MFSVQELLSYRHDVLMPVTAVALVMEELCRLPAALVTTPQLLLFPEVVETGHYRSLQKSVGRDVQR